MHPEDTGCNIFVPTFTRNAGTDTEIFLHLQGRHSLTFVEDECSCGSDCRIANACEIDGTPALGTDYFGVKTHFKSSLTMVKKLADFGQPRG